MGKRILVIDDDEAVRESFSLALENTGYQVDTVESGEKGIEKVRDTKYDLIFLDLKMPGLDGVETMRELWKIDQDVPIYIATAFFAEFNDRLRKAAADGLSFEIIKKPLKGAQIRSIVKGILEDAGRIFDIPLPTERTKKGRQKVNVY